MMELILAGISGPAAGLKIVIAPGSTLRVGRSQAKSDWAIPSDDFMSGGHFAVTNDGERAIVRDLGSTNGTAVNGVHITEVEAGENDRISAGSSVFSVRFHKPALKRETAEVERPSATAAPSDSPLDLVLTAGAVAAGAGVVAAVATWPGYSEAQSALLSLLFSHSDPLYAVLDAALERSIPKLLAASDDRHASLFIGTEARDLAAVAPYLVALDRKSKTLEKLVKEGWGNSWGIYLHSAAGFEETRRHLRSQLSPQVPAQKPLYFRFYDPRVLRAFLPECVASEVTEFFGPVSEFVMEGDNAAIALRFRDTRSGVSRQTAPLTGTPAS